MELKRTQEALNRFAKDVVNSAREKAPSSNGSLKNSISSDVVVNPNSFSISFFMLPYGEFQDRGVDGKKVKYGAKGYDDRPLRYTDKMPPPSKLDKWIVKKGIAPRNSKGQFTGRSINTVGFQKSISFLIARSIYMKGIKPSLFFTTPFEKAFKTLPEEIVEKYALDLEDFLAFTVKEK